MRNLGKMDHFLFKDEMPSGIKTIYRAAAQNDVEALKEALKYYGINQKDKHGRVALHYAAQTRAVEAVRFLLNTPGIDATLADRHGRTAVEVAFDSWANLANDLMAELMPHCHPALFDESTEDDVAPRTAVVVPFKLPENRR